LCAAVYYAFQPSSLSPSSHVLYLYAANPPPPSPPCFPQSNITVGLPANDNYNLAILDQTNNGGGSKVVTSGNSNVLSLHISMFGAGADSRIASVWSITNNPSLLGFRGPLATGDISGDGLPDVVVTDRLTGVFKVYKQVAGQPNTLSAPVDYTYGPSYTPTQTVVAKLAGSPLGADVVHMLYQQPSVKVLFNNGAGGGGGSLLPVQTYSWGSGGAAAAMAVGDLDSDGRKDIAVTTTGGNILWLRNTGAGFATNGALMRVCPTDPTADPGYTGVGVGEGGLALADLNGDGKLDAAVHCHHTRTTGSGGSVRTYYLRVFLGRGDGNFDSTPAFEFQTGSADPADQPMTLAVGEFNNDGRHDVALINNSGPYRVQVFMGTGNGLFNQAPPIALPFSTSPYTLVTGDVNGDGRLDLVATATDSTSTVFLVGLGNGNFVI
jgi:hypothetical protein